MQIYSFSPFGYEGALVSVEVDLRRGIPAVDIVGLADGAVKESRERMRSAIRNCGFEFPPERVLISLSPADVRKEGAGFDLAVALSVLEAKASLDCAEKAAGAEKAASTGETEAEAAFRAQDVHKHEDAVLVMGELELNGKVRPVRGIHAAVSTAASGGIQLCIVPAANADEAREVPGMKVFGAEHLTEAFDALQHLECFTAKDSEAAGGASGIPHNADCIDGVYFPAILPDMDFAAITGQDFLVRALQIAAAGAHNVLAFGSPGCGKTLSLQRFPSLLPLLTMEEAQPVTRIYSIAGLLLPHEGMLRRPPFRQPHQTASIEGMCGGGAHCTPGEISLAHNGVLFLDEAPEFRTSVLQMLRVPLESGAVTLSRAGRSTVFPAQFQLLLAMNPCPCGFWGAKDKLCLCSAHAVEHYWKKISGPLLDRMDIRVQVHGKKPGAPRKTCGTPSAELRVPIAHAVHIQRKRQGKRNARLSPSEIASVCTCTDAARHLLDNATEHYGFSPRAVSSCLKLARTIADLAEKEVIDDVCMEEAVLYRKTEGGLDFSVA